MINIKDELRVSLRPWDVNRVITPPQHTFDNLHEMTSSCITETAIISLT